MVLEGIGGFVWLMMVFFGGWACGQAYNEWNEWKEDDYE